MQAKISFRNFEWTFSDDDVVNPDDYTPGEGEYFLLHDAGFVQAVVFADNLQDAIDIAVDAGKLDQFALSDEELNSGDYPEQENDNGPRGVSYLGNYGRPFDIESLGYVELANPKFSFAALVNAQESTVISCDV